MKHTCLSIIILLIAIGAKAQLKHDYVWVGGNDLTDSNFTNIIMDFNSDMLDIYRDTLLVDFFVTNASICDAGGNLLFFSNGCAIYDAFGQVMENGDDINPGIVHDNQCPNGGSYTSPKGMIILPKPGNAGEYYVFHDAITYGVASPYLVYHDRLYYTVVDMSQNGGLGAVMEKNELLTQDTLFGGTLSAVKHANGEDWWVIMAQEPNRGNRYYKALLTANGVSMVDTQHIGPYPNPFASSGGQAAFSPDGTKYALYSKPLQCWLFDFDRNTGQLSNFQALYADTTQGFFGSLAFSPNSRYLYIGTQFKLWQFDTEAPDIQASKILIDEYDGYKYAGVFATLFSYMQLGPDCKIYMV